MMRTRSSTAADPMGEMTKVDGAPAIRFERGLAHPVERVWRAITTPNGLAAWFPCRVEGDLTTVGASLTFLFGDDQPGLVAEQHTGTVLEVDAPRLLRFTWMQDELIAELRPDGNGGCKLTFTNIVRDKPDTTTRTAAGWHTCLDDFERSLEVGGGEAPPRDAWRPLYVRYVARDEVEGSSLAAHRSELADGRIELRYVRDLPHPIEQVWNGVITPEGQTMWYPTRIEGDLLTVGAELQYTWDGQEGDPIPGRVVACDPPREWSISGGEADDQRVDIVLEAIDANRTRMTFVHVLPADPDMEPTMSAGWHLYMNQFAAWLDGITMVANDGNHSALTEAYAAKYLIDQ